MLVLAPGQKYADSVIPVIFLHVLHKWDIMRELMRCYFGYVT